MKILVTGASGFIGSYIVEAALQRGHEVWAGVRATSSRQWLQCPGTQFATLDLGRPDVLCTQLRELRQQMGAPWDYVIHVAGATKSRDDVGFFRTNLRGTQNLVEALRAEQMMPSRLVFISSLSIFGAIREQEPYTEILDTDTPEPNTAYGRSKLAAEQWLAQQDDVPWVVLRPTGVYGPRERDYFLMAKSIAQHVDFAVGYRRQEITFVYVQDVVEAALLACQRQGVEHHAFFLSDGEVYTSRTFSDLLQSEMGVRHVMHIKAPLCVLRAVCYVSGTLAHAMGRLTTLNMDKYHILAQRNWRCDIEPARRLLGYTPQWPLQRGVAATVAWYKANGWL